jgi:hypothetical protein
MSFRRTLQEFMNVGLIRFGLFRGEAAQSRQQAWGNADGDELFGIARFWPANASRAFQLNVCRFWDVRKIDPVIRYRLCAPCGSPDVR